MNSVKTATLLLCEMIEGSELRNDVSSVLEQLAGTSSSQEVPMGGLFHFGIQRYGQFLDYLETHFRRQELMTAQPTVLIQSLTDNQLEVLATAHALLQAIVESVISDVFKTRPDFRSTASPYYGADPSWWVAARSVDQSFSDATRKLVEAIVQDAPARIVVQNMENLPTTIRPGLPAQFVKTMNALEKDASTAGVNGAPGSLYEIVVSSGRADEAGASLLSIFGDFCLRAQIQTVLQLLYQQFVSLKLAVLNDKNIVDVTYNGGNTIGHGLIVKAQALSEVTRIAPWDIVVTEHDYYHLHGFARVDAFHVSMNSKIGGIDTLNLRVLDDSLEPYSSLVALLLQVQPKT